MDLKTDIPNHSSSPPSPSSFTTPLDHLPSSPTTLLHHLSSQPPTLLHLPPSHYPFTIPLCNILLFIILMVSEMAQLVTNCRGRQHELFPEVSDGHLVWFSVKKLITVAKYIGTAHCLNVCFKGNQSTPPLQLLQTYRNGLSRLLRAKPDAVPLRGSGSLKEKEWSDSCSSGRVQGLVV